MATSAPTSRYLDRPSPSGLADVLDLILDKGLVIDVYLRVSLVGIELLTIDARIVVASVDTYLRFAEAVNRLDLRQEDDSQGVPQLMEEATSGAASSKTKGVLDAAKDKFSEAFDGDGDEDEEESSSGEQERGDEEGSDDDGGRRRKRRSSEQREREPAERPRRRRSE